MCVRTVVCLQSETCMTSCVNAAEGREQAVFLLQLRQKPRYEGLTQVLSLYD